MRDKSKITSIMMACILHGFLIASLVFVFEASDANIPSRPLMIKAKIVKEENLITPESYATETTILYDAIAKHHVRNKDEVVITTGIDEISNPLDATSEQIRKSA